MHSKQENFEKHKRKPAKFNSNECVLIVDMQFFAMFHQSSCSWLVNDWRRNQIIPGI